jgi:hypothetical protein
MASGAPAGAPGAGAASPALRADVERLASQLDDWGRRYLTRDWRPALAAVRAASGEMDAVFEQLAALSDPAELLSVAAPLGATGFHWALALERLVNSEAFQALAAALHRAANSSGAHEVVRASCGFAAGLAETQKIGRSWHKALPLLERALALRSRVLGAGSREALDVQHALGMGKYCLQAHKEAGPLLKAAYEGRKRLLGARDASTLLTLQYLSAVISRLGNARQGDALMRATLEGQEAALGPDHPHTSSTLNAMACLLEPRDGAAAAELFRRSLEGLAAALGESHGDANSSRDNLAGCLMDLKRQEEALPLYRASAEMWARHRNNPMCEEAVGARVQAARCLCDLKRHAEALELIDGMRGCRLGAVQALLCDMLTTVCEQAMRGTAERGAGRRPPATARGTGRRGQR